MFWSKHERSPSSGPKEADAAEVALLPRSPEESRSGRPKRGKNPSGIPVGHIVGDPDQNENKI